MKSSTTKSASERELFRQEIERQDALDPHDPFNHDSDCACWACIGKLQGSVVQAYVRRMRCRAQG